MSEQQVMITYDCGSDATYELCKDAGAALNKFDEIKSYSSNIKFYSVVCELELGLKEKEA